MGKEKNNKHRLVVTSMVIIILILAATFCNYKICEAACKLVSGKQEIKLDFFGKTGIPNLDIALQALEVVEAIVMDCPETELKWFLFTIKNPSLKLALQRHLAISRNKLQKSGLVTR